MPIVYECVAASLLDLILCDNWMSWMLFLVASHIFQDSEIGIDLV